MKTKIVWIVWVGALVVWAVASYTGHVFILLVPTPGKVLEAFGEMVTCPEHKSWLYDLCLWTALFTTLRTTLYSFILGLVIGAVFGGAVASYRLISAVFAPPINFLRAIPATALFSFFMIMFGFNNAQLAMATFVAALTVYVGVVDGTSHSPQEIVDAARLDGADEFELLTKVTWFTALPQIFANARVAINLALVLVIVGEMLAGGDGVGSLLRDAQWSYNTGVEWVCLIVLGCLGLGINKIMDLLRPKIIDWE